MRSQPQRLVSNLAVVTFSAAVLGACVASAPAQTTDKPALTFGMSTALTGPAAALGLSMRQGVQAAFDEANAAGGINGRRLKLIAADDGYEPARTGPNMRQLLDVDGVLGVIGNVGTPTAVAAIPIALEKRTLFFGALTGAGTLRKTPADRYVINFRASYAQETAAMVDALTDVAGLRPEEVAFFTQRDAYGDAGFSGGITALKRHGLQDEAATAHGRYERNTVAVEPALADILSADVAPRAVIMVGAYAPCAAFVKCARGRGFKGLFLNVSFVGTRPLIEALGTAGEGVIITQVVPPLEADVPLLNAYRAALAASAPGAAPDFNSVEGYAAARVLQLAIARIPTLPTREALVDAIESLGAFDIGLGASLALSPKRHQASDQVWPTVVRSGHAVALRWEELRQAPESRKASE